MELPGWLRSLADPILRLPKWQRFVILGAALLAFAALISVAYFGNRQEYGVLFSNLSPKDAGRIVKELQTKGVPYKLAKNGRTILVPRDRVYSLRLEFASEGLPRGSGVGFEIFDKTNIGMTEFMEHVNFVRALQGELARTISELKPIENAKVLLVLPKKSVFLEEQQPPKATVVVRLKPGVTLKPEQVRAIVHLVASAVEGLKPENVTVVDTNGVDLTEMLAQQKENLGKVALDRLEYRRKLEHLYERKIMSLLERTLGPGKAVAKVNVELDFSKIEKYKELYDPENVVRSEQEIEEKAQGRVPGAGGIPGVESNLGPAQQIMSKTQVNYSKRKVTRNYEISKTTEKVEIPPGFIKRITASVTVDGYYVKQKKGKKEVEVYKPLPPQELDAIKKLVMAAIGYDRKRGDRVEVVNVQFRNDLLKKQAEELKKMEQREFLIALIKYGAFFVFLILLLLFVIRPLVSYIVEGGEREVPEEKEAPTEAPPAATSEAQPEGVQAAPAVGTRVSRVVGDEEEEEELLPEVSPEDIAKELIGEEIFEELKTEKLKARAMLDKVRKWVDKNPVAAAKLVESWVEGEF